MKEVKLKSTAKIKMDDLNNIWYVSDIDSVLGKVDTNGRFNPVGGREFTSEMLTAIAAIADVMKSSKN